MERETQIFLCYPFGSQHQITCVTLESAKLENMKLVSTENRNSKNWSTGKHETEKETFGPQLYVNHKCSMWAPCVTWYWSILYSISCHTHCSIGWSISAIASVMRTRRSSMVGGKDGRYTCCFTKSQRKNHKVWGRGMWRPRQAFKILMASTSNPFSWISYIQFVSDIKVVMVWYPILLKNETFDVFKLIL